VEVRLARASAVIVQRVPAAAVQRFLDWQRGVTQAAEQFPGFSGTDIYPPAADRDEWVVVIHFDDEPALQSWLSSPVREQWLEKIRAEIGDGRLTTLPGGFAAWFTGRDGGPPPPPGWKMALTVLLGLYPTVMLLTLAFPGPHLSGLGPSLAMLIGNALSVSLLQWALMPALTALLGRWLGADPKQNRAVWVIGLALILLLLGGMTVLFRQVWG
jgi:antibiotic biosynthesis monooxygenase (ABM) superfamily enzyme